MLGTRRRQTLHDALFLLNLLKTNGWEINLATGIVKQVLEKRLPNELINFFGNKIGFLDVSFSDKRENYPLLIERATGLVGDWTTCVFFCDPRRYSDVLTARFPFDVRRFKIVVRCCSNEEENVLLQRPGTYVTRNFNNPELLRFLGIENHIPHPERRD